MIFFLLLLLFMALAFVAQQFIGPLPSIGARVFLMQIVMLYGAVSMPTWGMLALAFVGGLMWDLLHVIHVEGQVEIGLGWSIVLYTVLCAFMSGFRPLFLRGRWEIHCILTGLCVAAIPLAEYLMLSIRRLPVHFVFNQAVWWRIGGAGLAAMFLAPFFFFGLNYIAYLVGHNSHPDRTKER
jgi:hypothetical protein